MTDVLERPAVQAVPRTAEVRTKTEPPRRVELPSGARLLLAVLSGGAGAIHLAMVPSHWGESVAEGLSFAVVGWLQLAFAVAVWSRPSRLLLRLGILLNGAVVGAWVVSRTIGLPYGAHAGEAEDAGFVDVTTVAFELVLVACAAALLVRPRLGRRLAGRGFAVAAGAALGVLALTTATLASPGARDHGTHGAETAAGAGNSHGAGAAAAEDDKGLSLLSNGQHAHDMVVHELDAPTQKALDAQLDITREVAALTPTVADALAAGYQRVGPYFPGIGAHYMKRGFAGVTMNPDGVIDETDLRNPLMLIFDGTDRDSKIAGFMYYSMAGSEPAGFAGRNDYWHYHEQLCLKNTSEGIDVPFGLDHQATARQCERAGGYMLEASQYMVHVWSVPGFEMTKRYGGVFGEVNPKLDCADGTYYQLPIRQWAANRMNVCKAQ
jgi:hypothetical protein